jgi:hypothetical protein
MHQKQFFLLLMGLVLALCSYSQQEQRTTLSIKGNQFYIDGELTYKGRYWDGNKIE